MKKKRVLTMSLVIILVGVTMYYGRGVLLVAKTEEAYNIADCQGVVRRVTTIEQQYPTFIAPFIKPSSAWVEVCQAFLSTEAKHHAGERQIVYKELTEFLNIHGDTPLAPAAQTLLHENLFHWAAEQRQAGQYEAALNTYTLIQTEDETIKTKVISEQTQTYFEWADEQRKVGHYEAALNTYTLIQTEDETTKTKVISEQTQAYFEWADEQRKAGQYEAVLHTYELIQTSDSKIQTKIKEGQAQVYLEWAAEQCKAGQYEAALRIYGLIEATTPQIQTNIAKGKTQVYFDWAVEQHQAGHYETALNIYGLIESNDEETQLKIKEAQAQVYLDWAADEKKTGNTPQVEHLLTKLWDIQRIDLQQATSVGLTDTELMNALSRSTGVYAHQLMDDALSVACTDDRAIVSAALAVSETHHALIQGVDDKLPDDLQAITPGDLHYAICIEKREKEIEKCPYIFEGETTPSIHILRRMIAWDATVKDIRTGDIVDSRTITGFLPQECPREVSFNDYDLTITRGWHNGIVTYDGSAPEFRELEIWLRGEKSAHTNVVNVISFSSDGKYLASGSRDGTVRLWEMPSGKLLQTVRGHTDIVSAVSFYPSGYFWVSAALDGMIKLWRPELWNKSSWTAFNILNINDMLAKYSDRPVRVDVRSLAIEPNGKFLVSCAKDIWGDASELALWDIESGTSIKTKFTRMADFMSVTFRPDGKIIASADMDGIITLWEMPSFTVLKKLESRHSQETLSPFASPDNDEIARVNMVSRLIEPFWSLAFSPDGKLLASGGKDHKVRVWDISSVTVVNTLAGHEGAVNAVAFSPDGTFLASGAEDTTVKLWEIPTGTLVNTFKGHRYAVNSVAFRPDGKFLASGSADGKIRLWQMPSGRFIRDLSDPILSRSARTWSLTSQTH